MLLSSFEVFIVNFFKDYNYGARHRAVAEKIKDNAVIYFEVYFITPDPVNKRCTDRRKFSEKFWA